MNGRDHLGDLDVDVCILFKWTREIGCGATDRIEETPGILQWQNFENTLIKCWIP
jgi:hypothetical protein